MTKETVAALIAESERSLEKLEADRKSRKDFAESADLLRWTKDPQALELAELLLRVHDNDAVANAFELAEYFKGEAACLLEHLLLTTGYRRDLYTRMLVVCTYEGLKSLKRALAQEFQREIHASLGDSGLALAREVHGDVSALFRRALARFGEIRDGIGAHRETDAERRRRLLGTFVDWDVSTVSLAGIDVLRPVGHLYQRHVAVQAPERLKLFERIKEMGEELKARQIIPIDVGRGNAYKPRTETE